MAFVKMQEITMDSSGLASFTFSNIGQNFTHLRILGAIRNNRTVTAGDSMALRFNSDTAANYNTTTGSNTESWTTSTTSTFIYGAHSTSGASTANYFASLDLRILNYSNTSEHKSISSISFIPDATVGNQYARFNWGSWRNTAAITTITFIPNNGTLFTQYSTLTLYGIR